VGLTDLGSVAIVLLGDGTSSYPAAVRLSALGVGDTARVAGVRGGRATVRRLTALGLRVGSEITVSQRRGNGVVVISGNTRIALGPEMCGQIDVERSAAGVSG
jgi:ferrous iron transport protein A